MKHRIAKKAYCPYYRHEDTQVIYCDGYQEGQIATFNFANRRDAKEYKQTYCQNCWQKCRRVKEIENEKTTL